MSKFRFAAVGVTLLVLAACGPAHPGAAAVVSGTRIPITEVDDLAEEEGTAVTEERAVVPELVAGIGLRKGRGTHWDGIAREDVGALG